LIFVTQVKFVNCNYKLVCGNFWVLSNWIRELPTILGSNSKNSSIQASPG